MVFLHQWRRYRLLEYLIIGTPVLNRICDIPAMVTGDADRLQLLAAEHCAQAESTEVPVRLGCYAGVPHKPLAGAADPHDGSDAWARLQLPDNPCHAGS